MRLSLVSIGKICFQNPDIWKRTLLKSLLASVWLYSIDYFVTKILTFDRIDLVAARFDVQVAARWTPSLKRLIFNCQT